MAVLSSHAMSFCYWTDYEGKDPLLNVYNSCRECFMEADEQGVRLLKCARCQLVYYCSKECQVLNFSQHKRFCKRIQKLRNDIKEEETRVENLKLNWVDFIPEFFVHEETRPYQLKKLALVDEITQGLAWSSPSKETWETILDGLQNIAVMDVGDHFGLRYRVPFILIHLNRDEEAFAFCRWWDMYTIRFPLFKEEGRVYVNTKEGDVYLDIFELCSDKDPRNFSALMLLAVAIIKMRLVALHECRKCAIECFQNTSTGQKLSEVLPLISSVYMGDDTFCATMEDQRTQLGWIFRRIDINNPNLLTFLLCPETISRLALHPVDYIPNYEQYFLNSWHRIPGATELLGTHVLPNFKSGEVALAMPLSRIFQKGIMGA